MTTYWMSVGQEYHLEKDPAGHEIIAADRMPPEVGDLVLTSSGRWYRHTAPDSYVEERARLVAQRWQP